MTETIKGFKGFDKDLKCRGYQYELGQDFQEEGKIEACSKGFHFVRIHLMYFLIILHLPRME